MKAGHARPELARHVPSYSCTVLYVLAWKDHDYSSSHMIIILLMISAADPDACIDEKHLLIRGCDSRALKYNKLPTPYTEHRIGKINNHSKSIGQENDAFGDNNISLGFF